MALGKTVKKQSQKLDMTKGSIPKLMIQFAIPLLIGNLFQQMYNMVDSIVVGNFNGYQALSAVGTSWTPTMILMAMFLGIGTGATIMVSQFVGAGDLDRVRRTVHTATGFIFIVSLPVTILGIIFSPYILNFMNVPPDVYDMSYQYIAILFIGTIANLGYNMNSGVLRGMGDSRAPLIFLVLSSVVNIVLDLLFVAVFRWGVAGVGIATVIAQFTAWGYSIVFIRRHYPELEMPAFTLKVDLKLLKEMTRLGLPIGFNNAIFAFGFLFLQSLMNQQGSAFMAGTTAASRVDNITSLPLVSFGTAATTFAGQNAGARRMDRLRKGLGVAILLTMICNQVLMVPLLSVGKYALMLFNQEPAVLEVGYRCMWWILPWYWLFILYHMFNAYMNGAGEVRVPTISSLLMFWAVRLPAAYYFAAAFGAEYIYACYPVSWAAGALISGLYYATGRWKNRYLR